MDNAGHMARIKSWFVNHMSTKYKIGAAEHGGRLWRKNVITMLRDEIIDLPVYFEVLEKQHEDALAEIVQARAELDNFFNLSVIDTHITNAYNILAFGNPEGEIEEDKL